MQFYFYFIRRDKSLYKVDMYRDVVWQQRMCCFWTWSVKFIVAGVL